MERLTKVDGIGQNESIKCFACDLERAGAELEHCGYCEHWQAVLDRLAAYEDKIPFDRLDEAAALVKARDEGREVKNPLVYKCPDDCLRVVSDNGDDVTPPYSECEMLEECEHIGADFVSGCEENNAPLCPWYLSLETVEKTFWTMHEGEKLIAYTEAEAALGGGGDG